LAEKTSDIRLAAILAADVAQYTRLVEADTLGTVSAWTTARDEQIEPGVARHNGTIVKFTGDGFLAEFPTVQTAVECAIELQDELAINPLMFRMGVSMGDIVDDGRDIHGEGINIAARLEAIATPGGICISGDVYNLVRNRIDEEFEDLGQHKIKHVSMKIAIYAIKRFNAPNGISEERQTNSEQVARIREGSNWFKPWQAWSAGLLILAFASIGMFGFQSQPPPSEETAANERRNTQSMQPNIMPTPPTLKPAVIPKGPLIPGKSFQDCDICPVMFVVPAGNFMMGWKVGDADEKPVHEVTIPNNFAVGKYEVTFREWDACVASGGCGAYRPDDKGWGRLTRPAINVSWTDAQDYITWLRDRTGKKYRLLTEAEWEYAARGGSSSKYPWGVTLDAGKANYGRYRNRTVPVGTYEANAFGLHDVIGNVWEWVADCYSKSAYKSHAAYPAPVLDNQATCRRVLRGGAWNVDMSDGYDLLRTSIREKAKRKGRYSFFGVRVARDIN